MIGADTTSPALERIIVRFGRMLHAVGRRRGLGDAELDELTQEVRVRLWRALGEGEKIRQVQTSYVYRAAMSAALDIVRRRRARAEAPLEGAEGDAIDIGAEAASTGERPDTVLEQRELGERIDRAVGELSPPRDVVVRLHLSGYDRFEMAELLGWTEPKVRNLLYRGLGDLRALLLRQGIGPQRVT
jgi:RNA polymerase sigma-70 factor (ECF subfamily)